MGFHSVDDLVTALAPVGIPVAFPGTVGTAVPAIKLVHQGWEHQPGQRFLWATVDLNVTVPLEPFSEQVSELEQLVVATELALSGTDYQIATDHPIQTDTTGPRPVMWSNINVRFPTVELCP